MRIPRSFYALVTCLALATGARGAALSPDPTGLWYDPAQPGWGVQVAQQGEAAFATFFHYDDGHHPVWFVASNVADTGQRVDVLNERVYQGDLYRTSGPAFSAASFDPSAVGVTNVGKLTLFYIPSVGGKILSLTYQIDGVSVTRNVLPQSWGKDASNLAGDYSGGLFVMPAPSCTNLNPIPTFPTPLQFLATADNAAGTVHISWSQAPLPCDYTATYTRRGQLGTLEGALLCTSAFSAGPVLVGTLTVAEIRVGDQGFSGAAKLVTPSCEYDGAFGGVVKATPTRTGMQPDPTGVWYNTAEPGWGLSLDRQGDTTFAVLYVYDENHHPVWYAASNVIDTETSVNFLVGEAFAGTLYRTTGPAFGAMIDNTALSATPVGTIRVAYVGGTDTLSLSYTIDGVTVDKGLARQTWSSDIANLSGAFVGGAFLSGAGGDCPLPCPPAGCTAFGTGGLTFNATRTADSSVNITFGTGIDTSCTIAATFTQAGQFARLDGPVSCGPVGNALTSAGTLHMDRVTAGEHGFSGFANYQTPGCLYAGFVGGVKQP